MKEYKKFEETRKLTMSIKKLRTKIREKPIKKDKDRLKEMLRRRQILYFMRYRRSEKGIIAEKRYEATTGKIRKKTYRDKEKKQ